MFLKFLPVLVLISPVLIYHWVRHKIQPGSSTIFNIDDSVESLYGFTESWGISRFKLPVKLFGRYVDVSTIDRLNPHVENKFLENFNVIKIQSEPENVAFNDMLFTGQYYYYNGGVILQSIYPDNEIWELFYFDFTTTELKMLESFDAYFRLDHIPQNKNGELVLKGGNVNKKIKIKIVTASGISS